MKEVFEKIIEKLEELNIENQSCSKCAYREECDTMQEKNDIADNVCLCTMLMKLKSVEIVKQESSEYEECYKDCGECEAYDKENHHCPKFCKVITEAVKEIEENHNGWIPVSERLPEEHKQYDITTKNEAGIHSDTAIYNPFVGMWFWDEVENKPIEIEVLAWAEKREPYQPNGEAKE